MYADTRTPSMEHQWLTAGLSQVGIYDAAYIQEKLGIPQTEEVAVLLAAGYEKFTPDAPTRKMAETCFASCK